MLYPLGLNRGPKPWQFVNLAAISMVNLFLFGAVALHLLRVICFMGGVPRGTIGLAMSFAAVLQLFSFAIMGFVVPQLGTSTQSGTTYLLFQAWIQMVAVLLIAWTCYQRALVLRYTNPLIVPLAKGLSIVFVMVTVAARVAASVYEIPSFVLGETPAFSRDSYFSLRIASRLAMNAAAFVFLGFMVPSLFSFFHALDAAVASLRLQSFTAVQEVYVTASIIRHRLAPATMSSHAIQQQSSRTGMQKARSLLLDTSHFSARLRTAFAALIFAMNLVQILLNVINLLVAPVLFPLYQAGWALVLVRLFEFRSELEAPRSQDPFVNASQVSGSQQSFPTARAPGYEGQIHRQISIRGLGRQRQ